MIFVPKKLGLAAFTIGLIMGVSFGQSAIADSVKVGLTKGSGGGPIFIALERGYFASSGLDVQLVFFDASEAIAVAVVSGDVDFGTTGVSAGLYNLAGQGALKLIGGIAQEVPDFHMMAVVVSRQAHNAGLTSLAALSGHAVGVTAIGNGGHYSLALLEDKFHVDPSTVPVLALQSNSNVTSAVTGGKIDAAVAPIFTFTQSMNSGQVKLLSYVGDETPWQSAVLFTSTKTANNRGEIIHRFLSALAKGQKDYHDAFTGPDGTRQDQATAPAVLTILAKYFQLPIAQIDRNISYSDPEGRLDEKDVIRQIAWFKSRGLVKGNFDNASVIDKRYAVPLPGRE